MTTKPNPVVLMRRPDNWDEMTDEDQNEFALKVAEAMGFTDETEARSDGPG
jgi:hypothetical protein